MKLFVALLTPFDARGRVDLGRLRAHVLWLRLQGVDGFVPTGTAGELPYLGDREREAIHRTVLDAAPDLPVYPCTWDASPATMQFLTEAARDHGAAGVLIPPPLYYAVEDSVVREWYRAAASAGLPVLGNHNPARIPTPISSELYASLRAERLLAGMKDGSGDLFRLKRLATADPGRIFAGGDRIMAQAASIGGLGGFISGMANVWPGLCRRIVDGEGDLDEALLDRTTRLGRAGGLRAMKALLGMGCRMPLPDADPALVEGLPVAETI